MVRKLDFSLNLRDRLLIPSILKGEGDYDNNGTCVLKGILKLITWGEGGGVSKTLQKKRTISVNDPLPTVG